MEKKSGNALQDYIDMTKESASYAALSDANKRRCIMALTWTERADLLSGTYKQQQSILHSALHSFLYGIDAAADAKAGGKMFTEKELDYLSRGLVALIRDAGRAKELCMDRDAQKAIDRYTRELQQLNTKICTMEAGEG